MRDGALQGDRDLQRLILVVDDQRDHLQMIEQILADEASCYQIVPVSTTSEAVEFLQRKGGHEQAMRPDIVLMNMRLLDGQAQSILSTIKTDPSLRQIPTIILSSDASTDDILMSYQQRCNSFVLKPQDLTTLSEILQVIKSFWLDLVTLPL